MKIDKEMRKSIAKAQNITSLIKGKLKEKSKEIKDSVDLTNIAKSLSERREKIMKAN